MSGFLHLPGGPLRLVNATVPACAMGRPGDLVRVSLTLEGARITDAPAPEVDLKGAMVLPTYTGALDFSQVCGHTTKDGMRPP